MLNPIGWQSTGLPSYWLSICVGFMPSTGLPSYWLSICVGFMPSTGLPSYWLPACLCRQGSCVTPIGWLTNRKCLKVAEMLLIQATDCSAMELMGSDIISWEMEFHTLMLVCITLWWLRLGGSRLGLNSSMKAPRTRVPVGRRGPKRFLIAFHSICS